MVVSRDPGVSTSKRRSIRIVRSFLLGALAAAAACALLVYFETKHGQAHRAEIAQTSRAPHDVVHDVSAVTTPAVASSPPAARSKPVGPQKQTPASPGRAATSPVHATEREPDPAVSIRREGMAKTHADVLTVGKQGTRSLISFSITRSKRFKEIGPLAVQLRKADTRHSYCDLRLIVNGRQFEKKHVNLYEPVWITVNERTRPSELVVNSMTKDQISGFLREPRNRSAKLAQK